MFTDSASRLMRPYGLKNNSEVPLMVERYIADMGQPCAFRADGEFTSGAYVRIYDSRGIRRENTSPGTPKRNAPVESSIWRAAKAGHAARMEVFRLFPGFQLGDQERPLCQWWSPVARSRPMGSVIREPLCHNGEHRN